MRLITSEGESLKIKISRLVQIDEGLELYSPEQLIKAAYRLVLLNKAR
jgi:hypothetical protein